jgi:hypothetical protein
VSGLGKSGLSVDATRICNDAEVGVMDQGAPAPNPSGANVVVAHAARRRGIPRIKRRIIDRDRMLLESYGNRWNTQDDDPPEA